MTIPNTRSLDPGSNVGKSSSLMQHLANSFSPHLAVEGYSKLYTWIVIQMLDDIYIYKYIYIPKCSMYGIFTYIWLKVMVNVGKYSIHGAYGIYIYMNWLVRIDFSSNRMFQKRSRFKRFKFKNFNPRRTFPKCSRWTVNITWEKNTPIHFKSRDTGGATNRYKSSKSNPFSLISCADNPHFCRVKPTYDVKAPRFKSQVSGLSFELKLFTKIYSPEKSWLVQISFMPKYVHLNGASFGEHLKIVDVPWFSGKIQQKHAKTQNLSKPKKKSLPTSSKWPFDHTTGGHLSPEKVT